MLVANIQCTKWTWKLSGIQRNSKALVVCFFWSKIHKLQFLHQWPISVSKACRLHCMFPLHIIDFVLSCKSLVFIFISGKPTVLYTYRLHFSSQPWKGGISNDWLITNISWLPGKCKTRCIMVYVTVVNWMNEWWCVL